MRTQTGRFSRLTLAATFVLLLAAIGGCASSHYTVLEPASEPLTNFDVLEIRDFKSNLNDADSMNLANRFADQLYNKIMEDRAENPNESIFSEVVRGTDQTESVLILHGNVIAFDKGSQAARYFIGFGAGKAVCTIRATFINKETGTEVLKTDFDGELSMGFFGGSADEATNAVAKSFIEYFDDYFETDTANSVRVAGTTP